jgi:DMSO/TMAO reductase YedYZ heme-binding membrane subunit
MKDPGFAKFVLLVNGAVPLAMLSWDATHGQLGADPQNRALHITGMTALIFLMLTLAVTPVRKITGWNWLSHFRRMLGLYAFFYASVHFFIYFGLERGYSVSAVIQDTVKHNFILFGMTALLLMIPLAATSTNGIIKWMGAAKWKRLHQLVYVSAIAAVTHFAMFGKLGGWRTFEDFSHWPQTMFVAILVVLLGYRILAGNFRARKPVPAAAQHRADS